MKWARDFTCFALFGLQKLTGRGENFTQSVARQDMVCFVLIHFGNFLLSPLLGIQDFTSIHVVVVVSESCSYRFSGSCANYPRRWRNKKTFRRAFFEQQTGHGQTLAPLLFCRFEGAVGYDDLGES